jgi:hypothetical protein
MYGLNVNVETPQKSKVAAKGILTSTTMPSTIQQQPTISPPGFNAKNILIALNNWNKLNKNQQEIMSKMISKNWNSLDSDTKTKISNTIQSYNKPTFGPDVPPMIQSGPDYRQEISVYGGRKKITRKLVKGLKTRKLIKNRKNKTRLIIKNKKQTSTRRSK